MAALSPPKFDKGYISYAWFCLLCARNLFFVTRLKSNARYKVLERCPVAHETGVTSDNIIEVNYDRAKNWFFAESATKTQQPGNSTNF